MQWILIWDIFLFKFILLRYAIQEIISSIHLKKKSEIQVSKVIKWSSMFCSYSPLFCYDHISIQGLRTSEKLLLN